MGRTEGRVPLEREIVFGFEDLRGASQRCVRVPNNVRPGARGGRRVAHVFVQVFRCREGCCRRLLPVDLELSGRSDRLLFPLADNRDVVALAHHPDESRYASNGRLVDADQLGAGHRRFHVARMNHTGKPNIHSPFQRAVHLGRDVIALGRLADHLEFLDRLHLGHTGGRVDVVTRQRDIELLSADQFSVGDFPGGICFHSNHALADGELIDRHPKPYGCQLQQDSPGLGSHAPHGPAIGLDRIRTARSALINGDVCAAHDEAGFVVRDVEFIGHDLPKGRPGTLATIRLPDIESRSVVLMNDDPRIELSEVGVGIRTSSLGRRFGARSPCPSGERTGTGNGRGAEAHDEQARAFEEVPPGGRPGPLLQHFFDFFRNVREGSHATTSLIKAGPSAAFTFAARLMAAWTR